MKRRDRDGQLSRREFLKAGTMTAAALTLGGCAKNPVTGQSQFMLVSEEQEVQMDRDASPQQLSNDYGTTQDMALNEYVNGVGKSLSEKSHRPQMPFNYNVVNANYVNAYAFPGGTIACTRGIMLEVDNEAELAALLGHEIGHVNARHTSSRLSSQMVIGGVAGLGGAVIGAKYGGAWGSLAGGLGGLGAGLLLASYSRDDERQADALGMEYMTRAQYNPDGMIGLMEMLNEQHGREPSALEVMFATHPMSSERLSTARKTANEKYLGKKEYAVYRERYMDNTAELRKLGPAIKDMQQAEKLGGEKKYVEAEGKMSTALKAAPNDYTGLLLMSKLLMAQKKYDAALPYAQKAEQVYPGEAQAHQVSGVLLVQAKKYDQAYDSFAGYDKALPGNPYVGFFKGYSQEGMGNRDQAAREYYQFLQKVNKGDQAQHAYNRLVEWGYVR
ncbi:MULTISPECIES: M48 family metalloprotease [unclassified Pseudodesulfovibrio]|uniref:M48 family metalloprotease n=1 Tax=unclassified Pseudodesulfovibrio TaxID=2661612 RepID=UPI001F4F940D|nr:MULTISPECIES: M48 family metalloprotease [unclassified Pseudodesulfovibrio]MCJ2165650.1 M48 family metalloprotease [Pseudodesulfovibrio sp. S3-i]